MLNWWPILSGLWHQAAVAFIASFRMLGHFFTGVTKSTSTNETKPLGKAAESEPENDIVTTTTPLTGHSVSGDNWDTAYPHDLSQSSSRHIEIVQARRYYPPGVKQIIGRGIECYIGLLDQSTVLKYPCIPGNFESIYTENRLLEVLGSHPRVIASKGLTKNGLRLEYASNGNLNDYITTNIVTLGQRLRWCRQAAEAVEYIHTKQIIHCDINPRNLLLNETLDLKLADFQGMLKSSDGKVLLDGLSRECSKSFMPRDHGDYADIKTDIFALGSAIFFIMMKHEIFPELDSSNDDDDDEIERRFKRGQFPNDVHVCDVITSKCWGQHYDSAPEIVKDITRVQANVSREGELSEVEEWALDPKVSLLV